MRIYARRERDRYTRAIGLVVSRGFGLHVSVTMWRWSIHLHRRDPAMEAAMERIMKEESPSP